MKSFRVISIIVFCISLGLSVSASNAGEIEDLKKRLKFLEAQKEIKSKLDNMQKKIDSFQKELDNFRVQYDLKVEKGAGADASAKQEETKAADLPSKKVDSVGSFVWIMNSLSKLKKIDPFIEERNDFTKFIFHKRNGKWEIKNIVNLYSSEVTSAGDNKISMVGFPSTWRTNGIYKFAKKSDKCTLTHQKRKAIIFAWECGSE